MKPRPARGDRETQVTRPLRYVHALEQPLPLPSPSRATQPLLSLARTVSRASVGAIATGQVRVEKAAMLLSTLLKVRGPARACWLRRLCLQCASLIFCTGTRSRARRQTALSWHGPCTRHAKRCRCSRMWRLRGCGTPCWRHARCRSGRSGCLRSPPLCPSNRHLPPRMARNARCGCCATWQASSRTWTPPARVRRHCRHCRHAAAAVAVIAAHDSLNALCRADSRVGGGRAALRVLAAAVAAAAHAHAAKVRHAARSDGRVRAGHPGHAASPHLGRAPRRASRC